MLETSRVYECTGEASRHFAAYAPTFSELLRQVASFVQGVEAADTDADFQMTSPYFSDELYHTVVVVVNQKD